LRDLSDELEKRVATRIAELTAAQGSLAEEVGQREAAEARRTTDIAAMRRLHDLTFRIARETDLQKAAADHARCRDGSDPRRDGIAPALRPRYADARPGGTSRLHGVLETSARS